MGKTLILIHGRDFKPPRIPLEKLWRDALRHGIERDHKAKLPKYEKVTVAFVYYGDISNDFLVNEAKKKAPDFDADVVSRWKTLNKLKTYTKGEFSEKNYNKLPGKDAFKEGIADALGSMLSFFHISDPLVAAVAPDMREYWNDSSEFGTNIRFPMIEPLKTAMDRNDSICVVAHSLGTMIAFDTFWKFCHAGEYRPHYTDKKIDLFVTLGSPLADETVKRKLRGASASGDRRYPNNVRKWVNVAAEDDFISHDGQVADDYREMRKLKLVGEIRDEFVYNLALRDGKSNPHHEGGYLVHPAVAQAVADWL